MTHPPIEKHDDHPFGRPLPVRRRVWQATIAVALVGTAIGLTWYLSRPPRGPSTPGHDMATMTATSDGARPVHLSEDAARRIGVTWAVAELTPLGREIRTVGHVTFDERRVQAITSRVDGWVERLVVDVTGQPVRAGDPLLAIYSPMLVTAQEELLLARRLAVDVSEGSEDARRGARELVESARRRLQYFGMTDPVIDRMLESGAAERATTLFATASGVVVEKSVLQGQRIMAGESLYRVADLGRVWIEGDIFEQDLPAVRIGQPVTAELEAIPGERFAGRIAYVHPTLDPDTRTARVRVEFANGGQRLKPGMYATLRVQGAGRARALTLPRGAVLATGERSIVFVKQPDGRLAPRLVRTGIASDDRVEVLAGIAAGDTVVASATFLVDAESNLGSALGGMGDMPGMAITAPPATKPAPPPAGKAPHQGHGG